MTESHDASESPLDAPQTFQPATSYQVRDEFAELVRRDLLGPWDGEREQFPPTALGPRDRYLVGMLGPKRMVGTHEVNASELPDSEIAVSGDAKDDTELPEVLTPQNLGRIWASSMGLSFAVPAEVDVIAVVASWGSYDKTPVENAEGRKFRTWVRKPLMYSMELRLDAKPSYQEVLEPNGVHLAVHVRNQGARRVVEMTLVNAQPEPTERSEAAWLFQSELDIRALDGTAAMFLPIDDPNDAPATNEGEEAHLRMLYRNELRHANGRNVAVHAHVRDGERRAHRLRTTWIPEFNVPATEAPLTEYLTDVQLSMDALADAAPSTLASGLAPLADGYTTWLDERSSDIVALPQSLVDTAESAVLKARRVAGRIRAGINLLTDPNDPHHTVALQAFRFANKAMAAQRRNTTIGRDREKLNLGYAEARANVLSLGEAAASWRPFQLAFVLLNLPSLTDPTHPERAADDHTALVDLLFFPTGGGKTEAYLGLTAYTFAVRRLQKVIGSGEDARSGLDGVAVLMRYTLRLLTAQQFQRAAALVCAAEMLRREDENTWGTAPFRVGLWVGAGVSPNWYNDANEQIEEAKEAGRGDRVNALQTLSCPWCGEKLRGHHDLEAVAELRRVLLYCPRGEGASACPFSRRLSPSEGLPILTVDEEIYRLTPSLVIATVDKLAQLPWRGYAGHLFGRVSRRCPRHGYRHDDLDVRTGCKDMHLKPKVTSFPVTRLRPPDLIIQDELHLITGSLGTTVGLFESAVDQLCTWSAPDGHQTGPKIIASTATTKRADEQVLGIFGRKLSVFPPQVLDVADTFFSRQVPLSDKSPGRRYLGLCAHGIRLKQAEIRLAEILLIAGQTMFDTYGAPADPYMTLVGYFNATRELAGMRRYVDDDIATRVRRNGQAKGLANRLRSRSELLTVQELTSRISSGDISDVLTKLEIGFDPELDTSTRRRAIRTEQADSYREKGKEKRRVLHAVAQQFEDRQDGYQLPIDVVLATSMLQVGVDVSRFGLMVVTGQPKNTAEYIQASSRVGREADRPGLVITLYNWSRPRDLAHFEDFEHYHATFYRQVEALSVTPYTRRALDRGTAATFVAAVRQSTNGNSRNADAQDVSLDGEVVARVIDRLLRRAEAIGGQRAREYLLERIKRLTDHWKLRKTGQLTLGYEDKNAKGQQMVGLLDRAGTGGWTDFTVGQSMRETENEINLVLPGGGSIFAPQYGAPSWSFVVPPVSADADDHLAGDELGESTPNRGPR